MADLSTIPTQLRRILLDFTISCLIEKPTDFVEFGCEYFLKLRECRRVHVVDQVEEEEEEEEEAEVSKDFSMDKKALANRRASVVAERYNPEDDNDSILSVKIPKSDVVRKKLSDDIKGVLLFRSLEREELSSIMDAMAERTVEPGEIIIQQGETEADHFYVIYEGTFEASVKNESGVSKIVRTYQDSGSFGELALLYNVPRAATIRALTDGKLWVLDRITFRKIVLRSAYLKRERYQKLLESVEFLQELNSYDMLNLADSLMPMYFSDQQEIFHQGDVADGMYFLESGNVRCVIDHPVQGKVVVKELGVGEYVGELALVTHNRRALNAVSIGETKLAFLDKDTFERLLGPCTEVLTKSFQIYENQMALVVGSSTSVYFKAD